MSPIPRGSARLEPGLPSPRAHRSRTRDIVVADMAVGSKIWESWNRISYQVFQAIVRDEARQARDDPSAQVRNTWLCVPQLISNLACLTACTSAAGGPGDALRRELMNESPETGSIALNMPRTMMNLVGDELRQWGELPPLSVKTRNVHTGPSDHRSPEVHEILWL